MPVLPKKTVNRLLGNGYCGRSRELACQYETICGSCSMFFATIAHRDTIRAHGDDAAEQDQDPRPDVYDALLTRVCASTTASSWPGIQGGLLLGWPGQC